MKSPYCTNPQRHYLPLCGSAYRDLLEFSLALYSKNRQIRYCLQRRQAVERCENQSAKPAVVAPPEPAGSKGRIYLIDAMSFIFRAYHAMQRQRPMSTKTGIPTSATFVFVNMLRKLRADFAPQYLAAVFDVAAPTFRDEQAKAITSLRKFDSKTQTYVDVAYDGYKANRAQMPEDLAQQIPYIRRALDAYRIPILELPGFEADDVIGTLAHKAAGEGYSVFVVSSDKDMMQLVNERICVLNPPKDNLICDAAKVEEILGVPPERVVDVMALRGDSIDNIPGAPGIGDKGSVELDPALRQRGERAGPRGGGRAQDLSRVAAEQSRCGADKQGSGDDQDRASGGLRAGEDAGAGA